MGREWGTSEQLMPQPEDIQVYPSTQKQLSRLEASPVDSDTLLQFIWQFRPSHQKPLTHTHLYGPSLPEVWGLEAQSTWHRLLVRRDDMSTTTMIFIN